MRLSQRLDAVCEIAMGQAPSGDAYNYDRTGWPLIAGAGDFGAKYPECKKYTTEAARLSRSGDIVLGIRASIGEKVIADGEYCLGRGVAGLRGKTRLDSRYLWHWLTHARPVLASKAKGATFKQVNKDDIGELEIILPPLLEQRRIAAILDQADALRVKRREALAQLDSLTQSIFIEMFGDPVANSKRWLAAPLNTHVSKLGSGSTPTGGDAAYKESGISLIRSLNVHDGEFKYKNLAFIDAAQAVKLSNVVIAEGDVLLNITGASVARVCSVPSDVLPARVNQHVMIIRPKPTLNRLFLERLLLNPQMKTKLLQIGGAGATREAITKAQAEELVIPIPPIQIQNEFAARLSVLLAIKNDHRLALAELDSLFASLQHRAFRGKL